MGTQLTALPLSFPLQLRVRMLATGAVLGLSKCTRGWSFIPQENGLLRSKTKAVSLTEVIAVDFIEQRLR